MPLPLRCAIIEDEPLAQELLQRYIRRVNSLELIATFDDALEALTKLPALGPTLLLVDINMPELTGLDFLRNYPTPHPAVIMTTANPNHALDGFEIGVADYLLKPITFERFLKAIDRVVTRLPNETAEPGFVYLKTDRRLEQIHYDEIVFAEAFGDYMKVYLTERYILTHITMTKLAEALPSDRLLRINRSYLVQRKFIKTLTGNTVTMTTGHQLSIGTNYRDAVKKQIRHWLVSE
ncbi:LytR/AlgR family response regulator transcription factor [Spirosoma utsteinense]|uniref:LytR/AlgR family response regulator transcription factor n=1 Tax=Spirosoma utsteinense TaxID=2585773 RepID=UPI001648BDDB|nr:response regulator transcription factor [Spirosoma utsteinense]